MSRTLIDLVVTNKNSLKAKIRSRPNLSDHQLIELNLGTDKVSYNHEAVETRTICKTLKDVDYQFINEVLGEANWGYEAGEHDINKVADTYVNNIVNSINLVAPKREVKVNPRLKPKPWFNGSVVESQKRRDDAYVKAQLTNKDEDWSIYKVNRNNFVTHLRSEKQKFYLDKIDSNRHDSREMWKTLKQVIDEHKNVSNLHSSRPISFEADSSEVNVNVANKFNKYFVNSINNIVNSIEEPELVLPDMKDCTKENSDLLDSFKPITLEQLKTVIFSLPSKKGTNEGISMEVIKKTFWRCGHALLNIINMSIVTGEVPMNWLLSEIVPIPKISKANTPEEFRPINMLPAYEKILEKVIYNQLLEYVYDSDILHQNQSGFRRGHSCETAIQLVMEKWLKDLEDGNIIVAVFLDFKRAFETINRVRLLHKLSNYGIRGNALKWFRSYLTGRRQVTRYCNERSDEAYINYGVPQGSVLGPLLFILYINDIFNVNQDELRIFINLFADDTLVSFTGNCLKDACTLLNCFLKRLLDWLRSNKLKLNVNKTKCMLITTSKVVKNRILSENPVQDIMVDGTSIEFVNEFKYVGIVIDEHLSLKNNVNYVIKKMSKKIGFLARASKFLSYHTRLLIFKCIILPHLDYCSTMLWGVDNVSLDALQRLQSKGLKIVLKCDRFTPTKEVLERVNMLSVKQRITLNVLVFVHKLEQGILPEYLCKMIHHNKSNCRPNLRNNNHLSIARRKTVRSMHSIFYSGLRLYNEVEPDIKNTKDTHKFKENCLAFVTMRFPL